MTFRKLFYFSMLSLLTACASKSEHAVDCERACHAEQDWASLRCQSAQITEPLDLDTVIELAMECNLDLMAKAQEYQFHHETATAAKLKMIPSLIISGEASGRNRSTGSFSYSLIPGVPPAPPSISSDRGVKRYDISATWRLLDFGLSYYRSRQEVEAAFLKKLEYCRLQQVLVQECIIAYWKAQVGRHCIERSQTLLREAEELLETLRCPELVCEISKDLLYRDYLDLLEAQQYLRAFEHEYHESLQTLAELIGMPFSEIALIDEPMDLPEQVELDTEALARMALEYRPELFGLDAERRASLDDIKIAFLQLFPDLSLFASNRYESNTFLLFNHWLVGGLRYTIDLLRSPQHLQEMLAGAEKVELADVRSLGLSLGIVTQVQLAQLAYDHAYEDYELSSEIADGYHQLIDALEQRVEAGELSQARLLISHQFDAFYAEIHAWESYGNVQIARGHVNNAVGIPFFLDQDCDEVTSCCANSFSAQP